MIFAPDGTVIDRDALRSVGFGTGRQPTVRVDRDTDTKVVGGTWTESGNALTGYSGSAGGVYVGATTRQAFNVPAGTVRFVDCEAP